MRFKLLSLFIACSILNATASKKPFVIKNDPFGTRVFIENKGQFDNAIRVAEKVFYGYENGGEKIYFTNKGLVYKLTKARELTERQQEAIEHGKLFTPKPDEVYYVNMNWANSNSDIQIIESEKQNNYFSYGTPDLNSYGYKKITYKNVYNNIDIEYIIPAEKEYGIKYNVILHPGANPNDIKIVYSGDVNKITKDGNDILIKTPLEDITEHAPNSFYNNNDAIASEFSLTNNTIGFNFPRAYQNDKTVTIDPWVTTITTLTGNNYGYDVDYDYAGNLYVFGGKAPFKIAKYDPLGALLWTFSGTIVTPPWTSSGSVPAANYAGNFVVDKFTGKSYVGEGFNFNGTQIVRIDASGNYDFLISNQLSSWKEVWDMGFHCGTGKVYGLGGSTSSNQSAGLINTVTGTVAPTTFVPSVPNFGHDVVSNAIDDAGNIFIYYASVQATAINNHIAALNAAFTGTLWGGFSTYNVMTESANKNAYVGSGGISSNGFNCLAVNAQYLYFYDGLNLAAYNKASGVKIGFTTIAGNTLKAQGGIGVDDCNNVYLGGNTKIDVYNFNGTTFNFVTSIPLGVATLNKYVYDIKLDKNNNLLYVAGSGFIGTYSAVSSLTCTSNAFSVTTSCQGNNNGTAVASVTTTLASPLYNYLWTNAGGTVSATSNTLANTNTVTGLTNGTYTITIQVNAPCGPVYSNTVNINCVVVCSGVASAATSCSGANTNFSLSLGSTSGFTSTPTFTWTGPGAYTSNAQNPTFTNGAFGVYTVTATDGSCIFTTTVNTVDTRITPTITTTGTVTCVSGATLSAQAVTAPYTYNWNGPSIVGSNTGQSITVSAGGTYSCSILNTLTGCVGTTTALITSNVVAPVVTVFPTSGNLSCNGAPVSFTATCLPFSFNINGQWWAPGPIPIGGLSNSPLLGSFNAPGTYTAVFTDITNGCVGTNTVVVTANNTIPTMTVNALNGYTITCLQPCLVMNITSSATLAPKGYTWTNMATNASVTPVNGGYTICVPGNYLATFHDGNFCYVSQMITVSIDTVRPSPSVLTGLASNGFTLSCYHPCITPTVISNPLLSPSNYSWTVPPNLTVSSNTTTICLPNITSSTTPTNYTILAQGANGCVGRAKVPFYKDIFVPLYTAVFTPSAITCAVPCVALSPQTTFTTPTTFTFISPPPTTTATTAGALFCVPGPYTMNYTNTLNGCGATAYTTIPVNTTPPPINPIPTVTLACGSNTALITAGTTTNATYYTYNWTSPTGGSFTAPNGYSTGVNQSGTYFVNITNTITGCNSFNQVEVVDGGINVSFTADPANGFSPLNVNFTNTSQLGATTGTVYTWWGYGNGATNSYTNGGGVSPNGSATYPTAGVYTVVLVVTQSVTVAGNTTGCTGTATALVIVDLPSKLSIPNIFTPNGDGVNDVFLLQTTNLTDINCVIFDRWGVKMYDVHSQTGNIGWDGKNLFGKDVPAGTYFYLINATGKDTQSFEQHGSFSLYR